MQRRKCLICDKTAGLVACSAACTHPAVSCQACITQHVEARFSAYGLQPVPCIAHNCKTLLTETEVASNMSMEARARFSERTFNAMMQHEDNFVRCAGGCGYCDASAAAYCMLLQFDLSPQVWGYRGVQQRRGELELPHLRRVDLPHMQNPQPPRSHVPRHYFCHSCRAAGAIACGCVSR